MGLTQKQLDEAFAQGGSATSAYEDVRKRQQATQLQKAQQDAALAQLIKGKEMDQADKNEMLTRQLSEVERLRGMYGPEASVNVEGVSIGARDPLQSLLRARELSKPMLTPGQETSEKEGAKKVAAYGVAGGSPAMQKNIANQEAVMQELKTGKRDWYDKLAGKVAGGMPGVLGVIAPTEKARMDRIQAAAIQNIRATDPNPAQVLIDQTLSRAYDPRLSDAENLAKIQADYQTAKATQAQMEQASGNLQRTGYIMPGLAGNSPQPQTPPPQTKTIGGKTYIRTQRGWEEQ